MNMGIVLFGGVFIDRIGLRAGAILFCLLIAIGQVIVSLGVAIQNVQTAFLVMIAGRIVFSLGGESLSVAQNIFCSKWFKGKELALSFGATLSFSRIGSFANFIVSPALEASSGLVIAIWFGSLTCLISLAITGLASISDKVRDNHVKTEDISAATPFNVRDVFKFPLSLWLLYGICVSFYIGVFVFISISATPFLKANYHISDAEASTIKGLPYSMSAVLAALMGFAVDKLGRKPLWQFVASILIVMSYVVMTTSPVSWAITINHHVFHVGPLLSMIIMGVAYSLLAASLWPCVALIADESIVGTAYSIMNATQNAGLAVASVIAPAILDSCTEHGHSAGDCTTRPLYFLGAFGIISCFLSFWLIIVDSRNGGVLAKKSSEVAPIREVDESQPLIQ